VNCLNFGNPEHPEVMWQFSEVVEGMSEACEALGFPVIGGNVSFYNASGDDDIHPTPVAGVLGLIDDLRERPPAAALQPGNDIVVLGAIRPDLGGSEWAAVVHGLDGGMPPAADLERARKVHELVAALVRDGSLAGVHDVSDGGLAVALAEMAIAGEVGCKVELNFDGCTPAEACFAEPASVVLCSVDPSETAAVTGQAAALGIPARVIGVAAGERLIAKGAFDVAVADATHAWRDAIPALMNRT
jgi:phosphoribosylformylglycinamidine synthase